MRSPLTRYLLATYVRFYVAAMILGLALTIPFAMRALVTPLVVLPFAFASIAALGATLVQVGTWHEFEVLASLGVPFRRIAMPLWYAALLSLAAVSAAVLAILPRSTWAVGFVVAVLAGTAAAAATAIALVRRGHTASC